MAVSFESVTTPLGEWEPTMFPWVGEDHHAFKEYVNGIISTSEIKAASRGVTSSNGLYDDVVRAWFNYYAANAVLNRMLSSPSSVEFEGQGSASFSTSQIRFWREKVTGFLTKFEALVQQATEDLSVSSHVTQPTVEVRHRVRW